jgi:hypothetical protein
MDFGPADQGKGPAAETKFLSTTSVGCQAPCVLPGVRGAVLGRVFTRHAPGSAQSRDASQPVIKKKENIMKTYASTAVAGLFFLAGASIAAADTMVLSPDETTAIHEYVTTQKVAPIDPPSDFTLSVGATLPSTVEVHTLDVPKVKTKYDYVVIGKQTVLVEPGTRKVVQVID